MGPGPLVEQRSQTPLAAAAVIQWSWCHGAHHAHPLRGLFLVTNFSISGMSYNPEMESTLVIRISRQEDNKPFDLYLEAGRHIFNLGHAFCWKPI